MFQALFMLFDDEKHSFMINGNLVPVELEKKKNTHTEKRKKICMYEKGIAKFCESRGFSRN